MKGVYQEVKLLGRVVKWLIGLNVEHRAQCDVDKSFIKALLIVVFSVKAIKSGDFLEEDLMTFIKGTLSQFDHMEHNRCSVILLYICFLNRFVRATHW